MRIICDAPGQTCNRLWTYVASICECVVKRKHMVILFYDWTIEDFPNLLNCPFIHFPLWHKWYLERGNGWNNYKGLTWKATHSKRMDKVFKFFGCTKGWHTRDDIRYIKQAKQQLQHIYLFLHVLPPSLPPSPPSLAPLYGYLGVRGMRFFPTVSIARVRFLAQKKKLRSSVSVTAKKCTKHFLQTKNVLMPLIWAISTVYRRTSVVLTMINILQTAT